MIVSFISVPLTVRYLGPERYGIWVTISALMSWTTMADLGITNSLTSALSEAHGKDRRDLAQSYVAAGFWVLAGIAAILCGAFFLLWQKAPWIRIFNVQSQQAKAELPLAIIATFLIFALGLPFASVARIYGAHQRVAIANVWTSAGSILSLAAIIYVTRHQGGLILLVLATSGSVLLVNIASSAWLFTQSMPWLMPSFSAITSESIKRLGGLTSMFFFIQIAFLALFQTDNLVITHFLGPSAVTPYSVAFRLFAYTTIFQTLASPAYWPAYAEAIARGDLAWVRRGFRINFSLSIGSTLALAVPLIFAGRWIITKWAGPAAVPSFGLLVWMGVWNIVYAASLAQGIVLASCNRLRGQMIYQMIGSVVNITLSILLVQRIGVTGVILGTVIAHFCCVLIPQWIETNHALA